MKSEKSEMFSLYTQRSSQSISKLQTQMAMGEQMEIMAGEVVARENTWLNGKCAVRK